MWQDRMAGLMILRHRCLSAIAAGSANSVDAMAFQISLHDSAVVLVT